MKDYEEIVKLKLETISEDVFNLLHLKGEDPNRLFELIHHINIISNGTDRKYEDKEFLDLFLKNFTLEVIPYLFQYQKNYLRVKEHWMVTAKYLLEKGLKGIDFGKINLHKKGNNGDVLHPPSDI